MFKRILQKVVTFILIGAFLIIFMIGVFRVKRQNTLESVTPVSDNNSGVSVSSSPQISTSTSTNTTNQTPQSTQQSYTGTSYRTRWGDVTVAIVVKNNKIISISAPGIPDSPPSLYAKPLLIDQAMSSGSANIQGVSGATYTSIAFQRSLESAIAKAKL